MHYLNKIYFLINVISVWPPLFVIFYESGGFVNVYSVIFIPLQVKIETIYNRNV